MSEKIPIHEIYKETNLMQIHDTRYTKILKIVKLCCKVILKAHAKNDSSAYRNS